MDQYIAQYDVSNFQAVVENKLLFEGFTRFLKTQFNDEPAEFISIVKTYKAELKPLTRFIMAVDIIKKYIEAGASRQVNLDSTIVTNITNKYRSECSSEECSSTLFEEAFLAVELQLKFGWFKQYTTSDEFYDILIEQDKKKVNLMSLFGTPKVENLRPIGEFINDYKRQSVILETPRAKSKREKKEANKRFIISDAHSVLINDDTFDSFIAECRDQSLWKEFHNIRNVTFNTDWKGFKSTKKFYLGKNRYSKYMEVMILPFSAMEAFTVYTSKQYLDIESVMTTCDHLEYVKSGKYSVAIQHGKMELPFFASNRDQIVARCARRESDGKSISMIAKSVSHASVPPQKGYIRQVFHSLMLFEYVSDTSCRLISNILLDNKGTLPAFLTDYTFKKVRGDDLAKGISSARSKRKEMETKPRTSKRLSYTL